VSVQDKDTWRLTALVPETALNMATAGAAPTTSENSKGASLWFQRGLMATFVTTITMWYFSTPYVVRPHPKFGEDMNKLIANLSDPSLEQIENWTKWRLYLGEGGDSKVVHAMDQVAISDLEFPLRAHFEWRPTYTTEISRNWWTGKLSLQEKHPWYSKYGIYSHYKIQVVGKTIRFVPSFMFGLPVEWLEKLYPGGGEEIPIAGMIAESVEKDRVIVQCFMNLVIMAVVLMLFMNNPPKHAKIE